MLDGILTVILYLIVGTLLLIITTILLILSVYLIHGSLESVKCYENIPSYKMRPILSYWEWLIRAYRQESVRAYIFRMAMALCKGYGRERIVMIWIGFKPFIVFFKPENVEVQVVDLDECGTKRKFSSCTLKRAMELPVRTQPRFSRYQPLLNSSRTISKAGEYRFLEPWLGTGLLTSDGDKWRTHRKLLTPAFHFQILETFLSVFNEECSVLTKKLEVEVEKPWTDIVPMITMFTLDTICQTAMGVHMNIQSGSCRDYVEKIDQVSETFFYRAFRPWLWPDFCFLYCSPIGWRFRKNVQHIQEFTRKVIKEKKECMLKDESGGKSDETISGKPKRKAFLELLLQVHLKDSSFTEENIREEVDTFMFEGHDTTAMSISFTLYLLGRYPDVQEKVFQELEEIFGNDKEREVTSDDLKNMKYLECVVKESLRLYPSVPMIARKLTENLKVGEYTLMPGSTCVILPFMLHLDEEQFPRPELFDPDRFLPENSRKRHPFSYIPFSAGPRNCIGQRFALMEEKTALAHILRKFKATSLDPIDQVEIMASLILKNVRAIRIHFELRENTEERTT